MRGDQTKGVSDLVLIGVSSVDEECVWPPYLYDIDIDIDRILILIDIDRY